MKGILICGGTGSRLKPLTDITNKSLLPVYDKPLIEYPLGTLRSAAIADIIIVTGPEHMDQIANYLGDGSRFGCRFSFVVQKEPMGIAQALGLAESFADGESVCAILGDNIFFDDLSPAIKTFRKGGHVFLNEVEDPQRFGVAEVKADRVISIEEKPENPRSSLAQTGCYLFDSSCFEVIKHMKPSARGELEITDVTKHYLEQNKLTFTALKDEWVDAGTFESLYRAASLVREKKNQ